MKIFYGLIALASAYFLFDSAWIAYSKFKLSNTSETYVQAPANADIEVVEFLDYTCPTCQQFHTPLKRAIETDGRIRHIVRPVLPANFVESEKQAAVMAIAAGRQGKFFEAHNTLIENYRGITESYIEDFIQKLQLDPTQFRKDLEDPEIVKELSDNVSILAALNANTIPTLFINGRFVYKVGHEIPASEELQRLFNAARGL